MRQRTYVVTADTGTTILVVSADRTVEAYEKGYRAYAEQMHSISRQQAATFLRHARRDFIDVFTRPYGLLRIVED